MISIALCPIEELRLSDHVQCGLAASCKRDRPIDRRGSEKIWGELLVWSVVWNKEDGIDLL